MGSYQILHHLLLKFFSLQPLGAFPHVSPFWEYNDGPGQAAFIKKVYQHAEVEADWFPFPFAVKIVLTGAVEAGRVYSGWQFPITAGANPMHPVRQQRSRMNTAPLNHISPFTTSGVPARAGCHPRGRSSTDVPRGHPPGDSSQVDSEQLAIRTQPVFAGFPE